MNLRQTFLGSCAHVMVTVLRDGFRRAALVPDQVGRLEEYLDNHEFLTFWRKLAGTNSMFSNLFNMKGLI